MRRPQPYHKHIGKGKNAIPRGWYVNLNGKTTRLASEEEGEEAAYKEYDVLMAGRQPIKNDSPVVGLIDRFLTTTSPNRPPIPTTSTKTPSIPSPTSSAPSSASPT